MGSKSIQLKKCRSIKINGNVFSESEFEAEFQSNSGILKDVFHFLIEWNNNSDHIKQKTSGSTGSPKTMELPKRMLWNSAVNTCEYFELSVQSVLQLCLPMAFIAGKMMVVRSIVAESNLAVESPSSKPFEDLKQQITFSAVTPFQLINVLELYPEKLDLVNTLIVGGGVMSPSLRKKISRLSLNTFATYGMTETASHVALMNVKSKDEFVAIGDASFTTDLDSRLIINATSLGVKDLLTNDIVELTSEVSFKFLGRYDNIINSGGLKIIPEQIEESLKDSIKGNFFVAGVKDEALGDKVVLFVEGEEREIDIENVTLPISIKDVRFIKQFEMTKTDKVKRKATLMREGIS